MTKVSKNLSLLMFVFGMLSSKESFAQEKRRHLWRMIADEVSRVLPSGSGSYSKDWELAKQGKDEGVSAATSHVLSFSPTYIIASIVETALSPFFLSSEGIHGTSEESSKKSKEEEKEEENEEIKRLKRENAELKIKQKELIDKLNNQAERFIESYDPNSKVGLVEPELKLFLQRARQQILARHSIVSLGLGTPIENVKIEAKALETVLTDFTLCQKFLSLNAEAI